MTKLVCVCLVILGHTFAAAPQARTALQHGDGAGRASHARDDLPYRDAAVADLEFLLLAREAQEGERRVEHRLLEGECGEEADVRAC